MDELTLFSFSFFLPPELALFPVLPCLTSPSLGPRPTSQANRHTAVRTCQLVPISLFSASGRAWNTILAWKHLEK